MSKTTNNATKTKTYEKNEQPSIVVSKNINTTSLKVMNRGAIVSNCLLMNVNNNGLCSSKKKVYQPRWERVNKLSPHFRRIPPRRPSPCTAMRMRCPYNCNTPCSCKGVPSYKPQCPMELPKPCCRPQCDPFKSPLPTRYRIVSKTCRPNECGDCEYQEACGPCTEPCPPRCNRNRNCKWTVANRHENEDNETISSISHQQLEETNKFDDSVPGTNNEKLHSSGNDFRQLGCGTLLALELDVNNNGVSSSKSEYNFITPYSRRNNQPRYNRKRPSQMARIYIPRNPFQWRASKANGLGDSSQGIIDDQRNSTNDTTDEIKKSPDIIYNFIQLQRDPKTNKLEEYAPHEGYSVKKNSFRNGKPYGPEGEGPQTVNVANNSVLRSASISNLSKSPNILESTSPCNSFDPEQTKNAKERMKAKGRLGYRKSTPKRGGHRRSVDSQPAQLDDELRSPNPRSIHPAASSASGYPGLQSATSELTSGRAHTSSIRPSTAASQASARSVEFVTVNKRPVRKQPEFPMRLLDTAAGPQRRRLVMESPAQGVVVQTTFLSRNPRTGRRPYRLVSDRGRLLVDNHFDKDRDETRVLTLVPEGFTSRPCDESRNLLLENGIRVTNMPYLFESGRENGSEINSDSGLSPDDLPALSRLLNGEKVMMVGKKIVIGTPQSNQKEQKPSVYKRKISNEGASSTGYLSDSSESRDDWESRRRKRGDHPRPTNSSSSSSLSGGSSSTSGDYSSNNNTNTNCNNVYSELQIISHPTIRKNTFFKLAIQSTKAKDTTVKKHLCMKRKSKRSNVIKHTGCDSNNNNSIKRGGYVLDNSEEWTLREVNSIKNTHSREDVGVHRIRARATSTEPQLFKCTQTGESFESFWTESSGSDYELIEEAAKLGCTSSFCNIAPRLNKSSYRSVQFNPNMIHSSPDETYFEYEEDATCSNHVHQGECSSNMLSTCRYVSQENEAVDGLQRSFADQIVCECHLLRDDDSQIWDQQLRRCHQNQYIGGESPPLCHKDSFNVHQQPQKFHQEPKLCHQQPHMRHQEQHNMSYQKKHIIHQEQQNILQQEPNKRHHKPYRRRRKVTLTRSSSCQTTESSCQSNAKHISHVDKDHGCTLTFTGDKDTFELRFTMNKGK